MSKQKYRDRGVHSQKASRAAHIRLLMGALLVALSVAIPLLAGSFLVSWSEYHFESYATGWNAFLQFCSNIGALAALTGVGAIIWHLSEGAAWVFIAIAVFMVLVHAIYMSPEIMKAQIGNPHYDNRETLD